MRNALTTTDQETTFHGRDELNLIDFPIAVVKHQQPKKDDGNRHHRLIPRVILGGTGQWIIHKSVGDRRKAFDGAKNSPPKRAHRSRAEPARPWLPTRPRLGRHHPRPRGQGHSRVPHTPGSRRKPPQSGTLLQHKGGGASRSIKVQQLTLACSLPRYPQLSATWPPS